MLRNAQIIYLLWPGDEKVKPQREERGRKYIEYYVFIRN